MSKSIKLEHLRLLAERAKQEAQKAAENIVVPAYGLSKLEVAEEGFLSSYQLTKDGSAIGDKINIPKDFLVKSATLETVTTADTPYTGAVVGEKYIDFVINAKTGTAEANHIYLPVNDLVDKYTGGNGINISDHTVGIQIDTANANGLGVTADGLKLGAATTEAPGAMSAADKTKLDGMEYATDTEVNTMLNEVFGEPAQSGGTGSGE